MSGIRSTCRPAFLVAWFSLNCERNMSSAGQHSTILCHARVIRVYFGGIVLRGEGLVPDKSGKIWMLKSKTPLRSTVGKQKGKGSLLHGAPIADSKQFAQDQHLVAMVMWSEVCFAQFAFDVLALL